jgi:hypothetical protein
MWARSKTSRTLSNCPIAVEITAHALNKKNVEEIKIMREKLMKKLRESWIDRSACEAPHCSNFRARALSN